MTRITWNSSTKFVITALAFGAALASVRAADAAAYPQWDGKETVAEYAKRAKLEPTLSLDLGNGVKWEGVLIPAGNFVMGSPPGEAKTEKEAQIEKQHKVTLTQSF